MQREMTIILNETKKTKNNLKFSENNKKNKNFNVFFLYFFSLNG